MFVLQCQTGLVAVRCLSFGNATSVAGKICSYYPGLITSTHRSTSYHYFLSNNLNSEWQTANSNLTSVRSFCIVLITHFATLTKWIQQYCRFHSNLSYVFKYLMPCRHYFVVNTVLYDESNSQNIQTYLLMAWRVFRTYIEQL